MLDVRIVRHPERDTVEVYVGSGETAYHLGDHLDPTGRIVEQCAPYSERPPFVVLRDEEYEAIARAILAEYAPALADRQQLRDDLEDAREVRDRALGMVERIVQHGLPE